MPLAFPEELTIGIQAVDDDHRALYGAVGRLHAAMRAHDLSEVARLADHLLIYATEHFAREERLMIDAGYPGFPDHLARHGEFVRDLGRWRQRIAGQGPTPALVVELSHWVTGWLGEHIRKVDGQMARFLRARLTPPG